MICRTINCLALGEQLVPSAACERRIELLEKKKTGARERAGLFLSLRAEMKDGPLLHPARADRGTDSIITLRNKTVYYYCYSFSDKFTELPLKLWFHNSVLFIGHMEQYFFG